MAKVLEGPGMDLMQKWGIAVPHHVVVAHPDQLDHLSKANRWLVESRP